MYHLQISHLNHSNVPSEGAFQKGEALVDPLTQRWGQGSGAAPEVPGMDPGAWGSGNGSVATAFWMILVCEMSIFDDFRCFEMILDDFCLFDQFDYYSPSEF